jgi:hypothetical protein|tara:strand:+ start:239 stop:457 length:219 start_codon:yes stop_codon:yes gene_type:complete
MKFPRQHKTKRQKSKGIVNLLNTYNFTTNQDKQITIKAYFVEEAIIKFQKNYQRIGQKYYHPVVFTKVEKVA